MAIKLGEQNIGNIMLGDRPIKKVMLGDRLVFHKDFEFLDSVESTGVQYINTNIVPTQNSSTNIIFKQENDSIDESPFGSRYAAYQKQYTCFQGSQQRLFYSIGKNNYEIKNIEGLLFSNICDLTFSPYNLRLKYNNKTIEYNNPTFEASELANAIKMYLFGLNQNYILTRNFTGKIYRFNHNDSNSIDLIPCQNKTTKEIGMYDKISGQFFGNSGSGQFFGWHKNGDIALPLITQSFDFSHIDFSLDNAIKILDALQPVSTPQTITFSAYTTSIINASNNALAKVYDAVQKGWTIVGEGLKDYVELEWLEKTSSIGYDPRPLLYRADDLTMEYTILMPQQVSWLGGVGASQWVDDNYIIKIGLNLAEGCYGSQVISMNPSNLGYKVGDKVVVSINSKDFKLDNYQNHFTTQQLGGPTRSIGILRVPGSSYSCTAKICGVKFYRGDDLIIHLIPIKKMTSGEVMFINIAPQSQYTLVEVGTGAFIGGEPKQD